MYAYTVGELYSPTRTTWPETPHLTLSEQGIMLALFYRDPTDAEIAAVESGQARFGLISRPSMLLWLFRFGDAVGWADTPWTAARQTDPPAGLPGQHGEQLLLHTVLVDANTGILRAQRLTSLPVRMADGLRRALHEQAGADLAEADATQDQLYQSSTRQLVDRAEIVCKAATATATEEEHGTTAGPDEVLGRHVPGLVPGRSYPQPLSPALAPWYCYTVDGGHSIAVVVTTATEQLPDNPNDYGDYLVAVPVRTVLRTGWSSRHGWIHCPVPYDPNLGVITEPGDDEY